MIALIISQSEPTPDGFEIYHIYGNKSYGIRTSDTELLKMVNKGTMKLEAYTKILELMPIIKE